MELLKIIFDSAAALNGYWNLSIAVAFGVLTLMASAKPFTRHRSTRLFLTLAFIRFALSDLQVLNGTNIQRGMLKSLAVHPNVEVAIDAGPPNH